MKKIMLLFWKDNVIVFLLMIITSVCTTISSFVNAEILNSLITLNHQLFFKSILHLVVSFLLFLLFSYLQIIKSKKTAYKMSNYLRSEIINKVSTQSNSEFSKKNVGDYTSWLTNDINQIEQTGFAMVYEMTSQIVTLLLALIGLLFIHWSLLLLTIIEVIFMLQIPKFFSKRVQESTVEIAATNEETISNVTSFLSVFSVFYYFNALNYIKLNLQNNFNELKNKKNHQAVLMAKVEIIGGLGNVLGQVSCYAMSGYLALIGSISIGMLSTTSSLSGKIFNISGNISKYIAAINSVEPLLVKVNNFIKIDNLKEKDLVDNFEINTGITMDGVSFKYTENEYIIENLNFDFDLNNKYAIIGESGSGKSTIFNLIVKNIEPSIGKIKFNNIPINLIDTSYLLSEIVYIEQKASVFKGSLKENITLGENFLIEDIHKVLDYVGLSEFRDKLNMSIDEKGLNISGGQRQRITLARGLIRDPKVVLLDESTSNLDKNTSLEIENLLLSNKDLTIIMITHHLDKTIEEKLDGILKI